MNCIKCGIYAGILYDGACYSCYIEKNSRERVKFDYKCPECNGEFNQPAFDCTEEGTSLAGCNNNYRCPFCGFKMEGM